MTWRGRWSIAFGLAAIAGCKSSSPSAPTTFGVNITVDAHALSSAQLQSSRFGSLEVSGDETDIQRFPIDAAIGSGELRFRYVPKVQSGTLTFQFQALDAMGLVYGTGSSGPVTVTAGVAASATITLTATQGTPLGGDGAKCTANAECASGFCTDNVCCHEACHGTCASCAQTGKEGLCLFYDAGTDPEMECGGYSPPPSTGAGGKGGAGGHGTAGAGGHGAGGAAGSADAGASDAGETINPPDGGIMATASACGGVCNGHGQCHYADRGTVCGKPFCNSHRDLASITCDGNGTCGISLETCANGFACQLDTSPGMCRTKCSLDAECQTGFFCMGASSAGGGTCVPQKTLGTACTGDGECGSGHCASGVCCKTSCASPNSCDGSGVCKCQNLTCNAGVSCTLFYPDVDVDGFGDKNGTPKVGCADAPPSGYVADNTDCDDHDANAFPGQTAYFTTTSKGVGTFDYNCDGTVEKGVPEYPNATCTFCPSACAGNGCADPTSTTCASANAQASLACPRQGGICLLNTTTAVQTGAETALPVSSAVSQSTPIVIQLACCGCNDHAGFTSAVGCGLSGTYVTCGTCGSAAGTVGSGTATTSATKTQSCH